MVVVNFKRYGTDSRVLSRIFSLGEKILKGMVGGGGCTRRPHLSRGGLGACPPPITFLYFEPFESGFEAF